MKLEGTLEDLNILLRNAVTDDENIHVKIKIEFFTQKEIDKLYGIIGNILIKQGGMYWHDLGYNPPGHFYSLEIEVKNKELNLSALLVAENASRLFNSLDSNFYEIKQPNKYADIWS